MFFDIGFLLFSAALNGILSQSGKQRSCTAEIVEITIEPATCMIRRQLAIG